jgi:hypothetical protein
MQAAPLPGGATPHDPSPDLGGRVQRQLDFGDRERFPRILRRDCGVMLEPARVINYLMTNSLLRMC